MALHLRCHFCSWIEGGHGGGWGGDLIGENKFEINFRFSACEDLISARFCEHDYHKVGFQSVKVLEVIRIHNKMLNMQTECIELEFQEMRTNKLDKHKPEFLFLTSAPDFATVLEAAENGCIGSTPTEVCRLRYAR